MMLSQCANSQCRKPFLRLGEGKLFRVKADRIARLGEASFVSAQPLARVVEHYWLCGDCATEWTLVYDQNHAIALTSLRHPATGIVPLSEAMEKVPSAIRHFMKITRINDDTYHLLQDGDRQIEEEIDGQKLLSG